MAWRSKDRTNGIPVQDDDSDEEVEFSAKKILTPAERRAKLLAGGSMKDRAKKGKGGGQRAANGGHTGGGGQGGNDEELAGEDEEDEELMALEDEALEKNRELTDDVLNLKRITEETKQVGAATLVQLENQGEQLNNVQEKLVTLDHELRKGEKLMGQIGGCCGISLWRPKRGKKIKGPDYSNNEKKGEKYMDALGKGGKAADAPPEHTIDMTTQEKLKAETAFQDEVLDDVSDSLDVLKSMAKDMGGEMDKQDKVLDTLHEDTDQLNDRLKEVNKKGAKILAK